MLGFTLSSLSRRLQITPHSFSGGVTLSQHGAATRSLRCIQTTCASPKCQAACAPPKALKQVYETLTSRRVLNCTKSKKQEPELLQQGRTMALEPAAFSGFKRTWVACQELDLVEVLSVGILGSWSILALVHIFATTCGLRHSGGPPTISLSSLLG